MGRPVSRQTTFIGQVASVRGGTVTVRIRETPTTLIMVDGHSYRIGQIGAFLRIPLGYTQLYGVCTQVGADSLPHAESDEDSFILEKDPDSRLSGFRWLSLALFGESIGDTFDRGVAQFPTVGDEVHLVTPDDLQLIYARDTPRDDAITIGRIADSDGIPASLRLSTLVSRHACIVGSTGAGKSNLIAVILESVTDGRFPSARVLVVDPHGEYGNTLGGRVQRITTGPEANSDPSRLRVPYWALPLEQLLDLTMGPLQPVVVESIRSRVQEMKLEAARHLPTPLPTESITADSPIPFSIRKLWYELEDIERSTFSEANRQNDTTRLPRETDGDAASLMPPTYPPASTYNQAPFYNRQRRSISRQLDMLRSRLLDSRYSFMFSAADPLHPDEAGRTEEDLGSLVSGWIGSDSQVTAIDVSGIPSEIIGTIVGTMIQIIYDTLFWGMNLPIGSRQQPLLIIVDEAHRFLPTTGTSPAASIFSRIAKEGRKYGVGLLVVTQRPSDIDSAVLSQCGTMIALRVTSPSDKSAVSSAIPDDLGGLAAQIPALRTGEALVLGEAMHVPSRIRVNKAVDKPVGTDPDLAQAWRQDNERTASLYDAAIYNWRSQTSNTYLESPPDGLRPLPPQ